MNLKIQRRLAATVLKCSPQKVVFNTENLSEIKESITKIDIRNLIKNQMIGKEDPQGPSRIRARKTAIQKAKGKRCGQGSRKGKQTARLKSKKDWMNKIRKQRELLKILRDKKTLTTSEYQILYRRAGGGFFRNRRHLKIYINDLIKKKK